ncbi:MAG TPA: hypothetical protein VF310_12135 [Vicinamibacteria bacterium]
MAEPALTIPAVPLPAWHGTPRSPREAHYVGPTQTFDIPADVRADFEAVLADREKARAVRDDLALDEMAHRLDRHDARELSTTRFEVTDASRELGEMAGEAFMDRQFPGAEKVYPPDGAPSRSGDFDQVWKAKDEHGRDILVVVEAKGGSSGLGGRLLADGSYAQQGSAAYFDRIVEVMRQSPTGAKVADEISWHRTWDTVRYFEVRAPLKEEVDHTGTGKAKGHIELQPLQSREFDLSGRP